jgi:hypothetical protein
MTIRDLKEAINLGYLNLGAVKPEAKPALRIRLARLESELRKAELKEARF